jgi:hypothetical protein
MTSRALDFNEVNALAHQAVGLLPTEAEFTIEDTTRSVSYVLPQDVRGDHGLWRVTVSIGPGNSAVLHVNASRSPVEALSDLISELAGATGGTFRGRPFPDCPGHDHPSRVAIEGSAVFLRCPVTERTTNVLEPDRPTT